MNFRDAIKALISAIFSHPRTAVITAIVSSLGASGGALILRDAKHSKPSSVEMSDASPPGNTTTDTSTSRASTTRSPASIVNKISTTYAPLPNYESEPGNASGEITPTGIIGDAISAQGPGSTTGGNRRIASLSLAPSPAEHNVARQAGGDGSSMVTTIYPDVASSSVGTRTTNSTSTASSSTAILLGASGVGNQSALALIGAASFSAGICTKLTVSVTDASGNATVPVSNVTVALKGGSYGAFYSDSACTTTTTGVTLPAGSSGVPVYYMNPGQEALQITASNASYATGQLRTASTLATGAILFAPGMGTVQGLLISGNLFTWGVNQYGTVGIAGAGGVVNFPTQIPFGKSVISAATSTYFSCAVLSDGTVQCWGDNTFGVLGDGTTVAHYSPAPTLPLGQAATGVAIGSTGACALLSDATVKCWGTNFSGQLGDGTVTDHYSPAATTPIGQVVTALSMGGNFACALLSDGTVDCWGGNGFGQLGDGTTTDRHSPTATAALGQAATSISLGGFHGCALLSDRTVKCWGTNTSGQLGDGTTTNRSSPTATLALGQPAVSISLGGSTSCALLSNGTVKCWGRNNGKIGDGTTTDRSSPTLVKLPKSAVSLFAVNGSTYCSVLVDASVSCWGGALAPSSGSWVFPTSIQIPYQNSTLTLAPAVSQSCTAVTLGLSSLGSALSLPFSVDVALSDPTGLGGFFSDSSCHTVATQATFPALSSSQTIYYQTTSAVASTSSLYLEASPQVAGIGHQNFSGVAAGPANHLAFTAAGANANYNQCIAITAQSQDSGGYPSQVAGATYAITLAGQSLGSYYQDNACHNSIGFVSMPAGANQTTLYFSDPSDDDAYMQGTAGGLTTPSPFHITVGCGSGGCGGC